MKAFLVALVLLASIVMIALRLLRGRIPAGSAGPTGKAEAAIRSRKISDISGLSITLDVNEKPSLFILLAAGGTINRMGSGSGRDAGGELFIGRTSPTIFEAVRSQLTEATMRRLGQGYEHPNPHGDRCKLAVSFQFKDGTSNGFTFFYGSESEGVPEERRDVCNRRRTADRAVVRRLQAEYRPPRTGITPAPYHKRALPHFSRSLREVGFLADTLAF